MPYPKFKLQPIQLGNIASGVTISKSVDTDRNYKRVAGLLITVTDETGLKGSTFSEFVINGQSIFEDGFEPKLIYATTDVAPDIRFFTLGINEKALGNKCRFKYVDGTLAAAYPYQATLYLLLTDPVDEKVMQAAPPDAKDKRAVKDTGSLE
jgi:hypothetical protein